MPQRSSRMSGRKVRGSRQSVTGGKGDNASSKAEGGMPFEQIRVVDPDDKKTDRTPKPLLAAHNIPLPQPPGEGASSPNGEESHGQSLDRISSTSSRMGFYESGTVSPAEIEELEEAPMADAAKDTDAAGGAGEPGCGDGPERGLGSIAQSAEAQEPPLTEQELDHLHSVTLQETPTIWLLDKPAVVAPLDSEEGTRVQERNGRYTMLLRGREASDQFSDGCAQTLNPLHKQKQMQYGLPKTAAVCCQASTWDIYDVFDQLNTLASERDEAPAGSSQAQSTDVLALAAAVSYGSVPSGGAERPTNPDANRSSSMTASGAFDGRLSNMSMMGGSAEEVQPRLADAAPAMAMEPTQAGPPPIAHLSAEMLPRLQLLECAVTQNLYMPQLLLYRDMKLSLAEEEPPEPPAPLEAPVSASSATWADAAELGARPPDAAAPDAAPAPMPLEEVAALEEEDVEGGGPPAADPADLPKLKLLWIWECELTQGRNVAAMAWHPFCTDLLAVGYASYSFEEQPDGLVALWSLKNPKYPLWSFHTDSGVTALDFSTHAANMLAVGLYNGTVAMYDVRNRCPEAIIASDSCNGKHGDPVWKLQWLLRTSTSQEVLISISTDGRVTQWSTTKGLEFTDLMKLKKVARKSQAPPGAKGGNVQQEAFISRLTSGMTFDFSWRDERLYIAGTEDGWIHKCSTSYSEQYLESYQGHMGPIYQVQWSPYRNNLFISCSADWTVRLWQEGRSSQLLTFRRANHDINDVQWCPANSTVFATATSGGYLELWDIAYSTLKPVAEDFLDGTSRSCLLFGKNSPVVVVGGNDGGVAVYRVLDIYRNDLAKEQQVDLLDAAMRANVIKVVPAT